MNKEAVEAVAREIAEEDGHDWDALREYYLRIASVAIEAARPHILEAEAVKLDEQHRQWCIGHGRNPADYGSKYSVAAAAIRAAKETGE